MKKRDSYPNHRSPQADLDITPDDYISRIQFIRRAQDLGFTLREVKDLLKLKVDKKATCGQVMKRTDEKIAEIDQKIKDLQQMKKSLNQIRECCEDGTQTLTECPILECFETNGGCS